MPCERRKVDGPSIIVDTNSIIFKGECHKKLIRPQIIAANKLSYQTLNRGIVKITDHVTPRPPNPHRLALP
jgi:hypothetical protein